MTSLFTPDPDTTGLGRCDNCNSIFWIKDTISRPSGVYCSDGCASTELCHKAEWNRIPDRKMIKVLVKHEDIWAKRGLEAMGRAVKPGGPLHRSFSLESAINIASLVEAVERHGWTPALLEQTKKVLPKYAGYLWDLAVLKQRKRDEALGDIA